MNKNSMPHRIDLPYQDMPRQWYNIAADMPNRPLPYLHPATKKPATPEQMSAIFPMSIVEQEMSTERYIDIPEAVLEKYSLFRTTPLYRAFELEKALDTPARIYYKYEGANPSGSHKLNSAVAQAYYNKLDGTKRLTTETGAGQWGTALAMACQMFGLECVVYMVKVSYEQKPQRRVIMNTFGGEVYPSPSPRTEAGRRALERDPSSTGSLGIAISDAVEDALRSENTHYALGSVLNHVCLHQSIIGEEARKQLALVEEYPDIVIACNGGGTNFAGIAYPFLRDKISGEKPDTRYIAVEALACPKLTRGKMAYDYSDTAGLTPVSSMYSLGSDYHPPGIHAGGLRYHGDSGLLSQLYHDGLVEASAIAQQEVFEAAMLFAQKEALLPAPESAHAIAQAIREAKACRESGEEKVILFNLSGHGFMDLAAYERFMKGEIHDDAEAIDAEIRRAQSRIPDFSGEEEKAV